MTILEVVKGWHKLGREDKIQQFFEQIAVAEVLTLELSDAKLAGRIYADLERTGQPIGLADAIIAAIAIQQDLTLALFCHFPRGQYLEALPVNQYKLSYYKNLVLVFVIRKKSGDRLLYKRSRIQKLQEFSESDRRGIGWFIPAYPLIFTKA